MAVATYTGDADQLFKVINQIITKTKELQKLNTQLQFDAKLAPGSLTGLRTNVAKAAEIISKNVSISLQVKATNIAATVRSVREAFSKSIQAKVSPYVTNASIKTVKDRIKAVIAGSYAEVGLRFQAGAAAKFRQTLRSMLAVLSRGSYIDAQLRIKGSTQTLDALKNKKITVDFDVKTGTAAKIKALLELLKKLREGAKVPIKLDISPGLEALLKTLVKDLKAAADAAQRLDRRLGGAASSAGNLGSAASGVPGILGRIRDGIVSFASSIILVQGLHQAFAALKSAIIDYPALLESAQVGFDRMLGSAERGQEMMKAIRDFAIPTPFEVENLIPKAHQAFAFNLVDPKSKNAIQEVIALLRDVGDAAFGLGKGQEGVDRIMLAFGQMHTAQKVNAQDLRQLQEVGINAWEYLAKATGKTGAEVRKLVTAGLIPADEAIQAIRAGLQGKFGGGMEAATKTFIGAVAQLKDASKDKLSSFFEPQFRALSDFTVKAARVLGSREFDRWLTAFAGKVSETFAWVIGVYDGFVEQIRQGNPILLGVLAVLGAKFLWLADAAIGRALFAAGVSIGRFAASILALPAPLLIAIAAAAAFGLAYKKNFLGVKGITDSVVNFVIDGVKTLSWALGKAVETVAGLLQKIPDSLLNAIVPFGSLLKNALGDQTGLADGLIQDFEDFDKRAAEWRKNLEATFNIDNLGTEVKSALGKLLPDITKALGEKGAKVSVGGTITMPTIDTGDKAGEKAALKRKKDALNDVAKAYDNEAKAAEKAAKAIADGAKSQIEALTGFRDQFRDVFGDLQNQLVQLGVIDNPLGPLIANFEQLLELGGKSRNIIGNARQQISQLEKVARTKRELAQGARSQVERLSGLDGNVPGESGTSLASSSTGGAMPSFLRAMANNVGGTIGKQCGATITAFLHQAGIQGTATSIARSGNARPNADGTYAPGTIFNFKGGRSGYRVNHYATVAPDGQHWLESNWHGKGQAPNMITSSRRINWARDIAAATWGGRRNIGQPGGVTPGAGTSKANFVIDRALTRNAVKDGNAFDFDLSTIDGTLSKVQAVPKAWGDAVKQTETSTARFTIQSLLATQKFQNEIEAYAKANGISIDSVIAKLRDFANQVDTVLNRKKAVDAVAASILDLQKQTKAVGTEKNPFASILADFEKSGKLSTAWDKQVSLLDAQRALSVAQVANATREMVKAENLKIKALKEAAPYLTAAYAGTSIYAEMLDKATRRIELWQDAQIQGMLEEASTYDKLGGAALKAATDLDKAAKLVRDSGLDFGLSLVLQEEANQKRAQGKGLKGRAAGLRTDANKQVNDREKAANDSAEDTRKQKLVQNGLDFDFTAQRDLAIAQREREILLNEKLSSQEKQIQLSREKYIRDTTAELNKNNDYSPAEIFAGKPGEEATRRADQIDFGAQFKFDAINEFNAARDEAARGLATFGDTSALAGAKFDIAQGKLAGLTKEQKEQYLTNQAAILGLQRYGQEFDNLFGQKYALAAENLERQMSLTQGLSALQKQELQWQQQDAEQAARNKDLTDEQREAYEQQRKKVLALRNEVRKLLADQQSLAAAEWLKGSQRSFVLMMEQDDIKRARADLENQLRDQGFTDPVVIKAILDVNEFQLRAEQSLSHIKDYVSQVQNVFGQGFDQAFEKGPRGFFEGVIKGFADMIQQVSTQVLSAKLTEMFVKAFPSLGAYYDQAATETQKLTDATVQSAFASTGAATAYSVQTAALVALTAAAIAYQAVTGQPIPNAPSSRGGREGSAGATSAAIGERYVPYDGALYRLHRGESVLTRRETELRNSLAASPSSYGSSGSNGTMRGSDTINIANVNMPPGTDAKNFVSRTKSEIAPRLSRRSQQNLAYDRVSPGGRQR